MVAMKWFGVALGPGCEPVIVNLDGYVKTKKSLQWLYADAATCGTPAWIGKGLTCVCFKRKGAYERICINLTPLQASNFPVCDSFISKLQEERLKRLKHRMKVYFDSSRPDHQEALRALWSATYPGQELQGLISDQWKEMGWQGRDPSTDFRGAGFISLENLLFFAKTFSTSFQRLLKKQGGKRAAWEYPFAVAGVNITFMIMQMLDLDASYSFLQQNLGHLSDQFSYRCYQVRAATNPSKQSMRVVSGLVLPYLPMVKWLRYKRSKNEWAFDLLYCVAFMVMDKQWLERNATYMEFNDVLKSTRAQLERELLMDDVLRIEDMPSYSLLC
ncbi:ELMO domain - like 2 [Theobroma cacao]|nr:ELMO domain - like 2 [Theobroma cacao]